MDSTYFWSGLKRPCFLKFSCIVSQKQQVEFLFSSLLFLIVKIAKVDIVGHKNVFFQEMLTYIEHLNNFQVVGKSSLWLCWSQIKPQQQFNECSSLCSKYLFLICRSHELSKTQKYPTGSTFTKTKFHFLIYFLDVWKKKEKKLLNKWFVIPHRGSSQMTSRLLRIRRLFSTKALVLSSQNRSSWHLCTTTYK